MRRRTVGLNRSAVPGSSRMRKTTPRLLSVRVVWSVERWSSVLKRSRKTVRQWFTQSPMCLCPALVGMLSETFCVWPAATTTNAKRTTRSDGVVRTFERKKGLYEHNQPPEMPGSPALCNSRQIVPAPIITASKTTKSSSIISYHFMRESLLSNWHARLFVG
jgi:hypothetical protein